MDGNRRRVCGIFIVFSGVVCVMEFLEKIGNYLMDQGPWAVMAGIGFWAAYKLVERLIGVVERNSAAFARVEAVMDRVLEKLDV